MANFRSVVWHRKTRQILQIPKDGLEYAWVSEKGVQLHQFVWCKDFLQDVVWAHVNKRTVICHGFKYEPFETELSLDKVRFLITNAIDHNFRAKIPNCRDFIHQFESQLNMRKTVFEECGNPPPQYRKSGVFYLTGSPRWLHSPPMMSLYSLLIRVGFVHRQGQLWSDTIRNITDGQTKAYNYRRPHTDDGVRHQLDDDKKFLEKGLPGILDILECGDKKIFHSDIARNYPQDRKTFYGKREPITVYTVHHNLGLQCFSNHDAAQFVPYWYRNLEKKR